MNIFINGESREVIDDMAVSDLLSLLDLKPERLAIEVNRRIVRRSEWDSTRLKEGDKVEIVHFVGGGSDKFS